MVLAQRFGWSLGGVALLLLAVFTACAGKSPEERLVENRSRYTAELNGFYIEETPLIQETVEEAAEEGDASAADEGAGDTETDAEAGAADVPVVQNAHLDILVKHDSFEKLPGVTLDISMVDAGQNEKAHWRVWVDTADVERANPTQYSHVLEDIDYEEGDGFHVEVRHPVPEAERGEYREFSDLGG